MTSAKLGKMIRRHQIRFKLVFTKDSVFHEVLAGDWYVAGKPGQPLDVALLEGLRLLGEPV